MTITLLTGNHFKIETAQLALQPFEIKVEGYKTNLPEIQDDSVLNVAKDMAIKEAKKLNKPVVREDHGFAIEALNNFPGPYMAFVEKTLSPQHVLNLMKDEKNRNATFDLGLVYAHPNGETIELLSQVKCQILNEIKLDNKLAKEKSYDPGWSSIIAFRDDQRSWAEFPYQERMENFTSNYTKLGKILTDAK
jgi:XTP/dITP diphosphohydrolase